MTTRREVLVAGAFGFVAFRRAFAQSKPVRIGMLASRPLSESIYSSHVVQRLELLGYGRGEKMALEYRYLGGAFPTYAKLVKELVDLDCDLILNLGTAPAAIALKDARIKTPIVFLAINYDPVRARVVESLRRPGGNATGVYLQHEAIAAKRIDLMRELLPAARNLAVFSDENTNEQLDAVEAAAARGGLGLTITRFEKEPYDFARALELAKKARVDGVVLLGSPAFAAKWEEIGSLLRKHQIMGIGSTGAADAGFLMAYAADNVKVAARAADMAVRILKGANPAETPVEQADEFELVINVRAANSLGVKVPVSLLLRATRVIQ